MDAQFENYYLSMKNRGVKLYKSCNYYILMHDSLYDFLRVFSNKINDFYSFKTNQLTEITDYKKVCEIILKYDVLDALDIRPLDFGDFKNTVDQSYRETDYYMLNSFLDEYDIEIEEHLNQYYHE